MPHENFDHTRFNWKMQRWSPAEGWSQAIFPYGNYGTSGPCPWQFLIDRFLVGSWRTLVLIVIAHNAHGISDYGIKSRDRIQQVHNAAGSMAHFPRHAFTPSGCSTIPSYPFGSNR